MVGESIAASWICFEVTQVSEVGESIAASWRCFEVTQVSEVGDSIAEMNLAETVREATPPV